MPVMNEFETTREIRQRGKGTNTPIMAMTSSILDQARQRCLNAGMDAYLTKPSQEVELVSILNKWLKVNGSPRIQTRTPVRSHSWPVNHLPNGHGPEVSVLKPPYQLETEEYTRN